MNVKSIARATALAATVAVSLTIAACGADGADGAGDAGQTESAAADSSGGSGSEAGTDADDSSTPGSAAATSQPETEMPEAEDAGPHNDADVSFTRMMLSHHQQAVAMAGLIDGRTDNADIIDLGTKIAEAQSREIEQMSARLAAWGEDPTAPSVHEGHGESAQHMEGMLSDDQMQALADAQGPEFDRLFLEGMIEHHEGAVGMAEDVIRDGENEATRTLAEGIVDSQKAEIEEMKGLLGD
ncbi:DUF305 domain-containing protein [Corynebacterium sp. NPDC060344]|uniref:DUF305 domain-containing protein n=1 Tax=Corynebacterium sp. NPDC060344 TaxID=3347101 RepID=UPI00364C571E